MHPDVAALLAVQADDLVIRGLETGIADLAPRLDALAAECEGARGALAQTRQLVESEERRRRDVDARSADHRKLQERHQAVLNTVTNQREATAATAQVDQATKILNEDKRELALITQRLDELRHLAVERERGLEVLEAALRDATASVDLDRGGLEEQLAQARAAREAHVREVSRPLLSRYDRIRSRKRVHAVFPMRDTSCSNCDTTIPLQRRSRMVGTGATEVCEGCGVLLYVVE